MSDGTVSRVLISMMSGEDWSVEPGEIVIGFWGETPEPVPIPLSIIPSVLSKPEAWIEFDSKSRWDADDRPEWEDPEPWHLSRVRLFGRAAATVSLLYEGAEV